MAAGFIQGIEVGVSEGMGVVDIDSRGTDDIEDVGIFGQVMEIFGFDIEAFNSAIGFFGPGMQNVILSTTQTEKTKQND